MKIEIKKSDRIIMLFLPAAVIFLIYTLFVNPAQQVKHKKASEDYDSAHKARATDQEVLVANTRLVDAGEKQAKLGHLLEDQQARVDGLCSQLGGDAWQMASVEHVEQLAVKNAVAIISQEQVATPKLSKSMMGVFKKIDQTAKDSPLRFRHYKLRGRYANVVSMICELASSTSSMIVPMAIDLDTGKSVDGMHTWELLVAM